MNDSLFKANRIILAGTGSGCGKTTVACALLQAFKNRGLEVGAGKCGPDYIDPMFHRSVIGAPSANFDPFFFDEDRLCYLLKANCEGRDITVIEGVMGYYDGIGADGRASTFEVAAKTHSPVILTVSAKGASLSVLAVIQGFLRFEEDSRIKGVILNDCTEGVYDMLAPLIEERLGVRALGYMPRIKDCELESRHLGLITADEIQDLKQKLDLLAEQAEKSIDLDGVLSIASEAPALSVKLPAIKRLEPFRLALARDRAFCFYYEDSLAVLREMGAELVPFSPLDDERLPENVHGLYLGGGYPELYAEALSQNTAMLKSIKAAVSGGLPCIAECGGFMYLTEAIGGFPMAGVIPARSFDNGRLTRFGYVTLTANRDNMLCKKGDTIAAHEFHRWDCDNTGEAFTARRPNGREWSCVFANDTLYAGYPHFHFLANLGFAESFCKACIVKADQISFSSCSGAVPDRSAERSAKATALLLQSDR